MLSTLPVVDMKRLVCIGFLFATLGLVIAAPAQAARGIRVQTFIETDGTGHLYASTSSTTVPPLAWEACTPDLKSCEPFARGREMVTTGAAAGTVFRIRDGGGETGASPVWRGPVKSLAPPRVAGVVAANEFVSPVQGVWSGGWRGENSEMQLSACATETAAPAECVSLTNPHYIRVPGCSRSNSFGLDPRFVGQYLRVADRQSGGPHAEAAYGVTGPFGAEVWGRGRITSVAIVGQIAPAANAPAGECGPPPAPTATISAEGVARVECGGGCSVVLIGTRKGRQELLTRRIPQQDLLRPQAALEMSLPLAALERLGTGKIRLNLEIDGTRWAHRTIRTSDS
jgi:hypothetical protein